MTTKELLSKRKDAQIVTVRVVKLSVRVVYIKAMDANLIMSARTDGVGLRVCQLGWYLVTQIASGNLNVHK